VTAQSAPISRSSVQSPYESRATIIAQANFKNLLAITATITWLCAAVRHSPDGQKLSTFSLSPDKNALMQFVVSPGDLIDKDSDESCWHALFKHQVIASGFPIPQRRTGKGLEISYANLVTLAQSLELVEYRDGLVAEGLETLLIPIAKLSEGDQSAVSDRDISQVLHFQIPIL
jgi:hypothetical protein